MSNNHVSIRLDQETMARVETLAPLFSTRWRQATRSDIFRALILTALEGYERDPAALRQLAAERATATAPPPGRRARSPAARAGVVTPQVDGAPSPRQRGPRGSR